jgi:hypothetical protein
VNLTGSSTAMNGEGLWFGTEVEGRLRGVPTMYVGALNYALRPSDVTDTGLTHIWFNPEYLGIQGFGSPKDFLDDGWLVTVNLTPAQFDLPSGRLFAKENASHPRLHIVLAIRLPDPDRAKQLFLSDDDEVRLDLGSGHVLCARLRDFVPSNPSEYSNDTPYVPHPLGR